MSSVFRIVLFLYGIFLTYLLLREPTSMGFCPVLFKGWDKAAHFVTFALLGIFFLFSFPGMKRFYYFCILISYAFFTEILQDETDNGRSLEFLDVVADSLGVTSAYFVHSKMEPLIAKIFSRFY
ncbi:MAG: VanZ family protein [Bergeyella sp.]|nr:VanZ family protein [Bergeyella sp.]